MVSGGAGNDLAFGDRNNDTVSGGEGDDQIYGNDGNDSLAGDAGNDTIYGGKADDSLQGGTGNDVLFGDRCNDVITGGDGADVFRFEYFLSADESEVPVANATDGNPLGCDTLTDFTPGEDKIQLDRRIVPELLAGVLAAGNFTITSTSATSAKIIYDSKTGLVYYNPTDATGDEVSLFQVNENLNVTSSDFEIF